MTDTLANLPRENGKNTPPHATFNPLQVITAERTLQFDLEKIVLAMIDGQVIEEQSSLIPNLLVNPPSIIAIDVKGELASITARIRSQKLNNRA